MLYDMAVSTQKKAYAAEIAAKDMKQKSEEYLAESKLNSPTGSTPTVPDIAVHIRD